MYGWLLLSVWSRRVLTVPTYFLIAVVTDWLNRQEQATSEYLKTENEILEPQPHFPEELEVIDELPPTR